MRGSWALSPRKIIAGVRQQYGKYRGATLVRYWREMSIRDAGQSDVGVAGLIARALICVPDFMPTGLLEAISLAERSAILDCSTIYR